MKLRPLTLAVIALLLINADISNCQSRTRPPPPRRRGITRVVNVGGSARTVVNDVTMQSGSVVDGTAKKNTGVIDVTPFHGGIPVEKAGKTVGLVETSSVQGVGAVETTAVQSGGDSKGRGAVVSGGVTEIQTGGTVETSASQGAGTLDGAAGVKTVNTVSAGGADTVSVTSVGDTPIVEGSQAMDMQGVQAAAQDIFENQETNTGVAADPFAADSAGTDPFAANTDPFADPFADPAAVDSGFPAAGTDPFDPFAVDMFDVATEATPTKPRIPPPINATTEAPATIAPESLLPALMPDGRYCNESYKRHPTKTNWFLQLSNGVWEEMMCPLHTGEVWREDLCRCDVELQEIIYVEPEKVNTCPGFYPHPNPHKYRQEVNGANITGACPGTLVWRQKTCNCDYGDAPARSMAAEEGPRCTIILNMPMQNSLKNEAAPYGVTEFNDGRRGRISRLRYVQIPGSEGNTAEIINQPLVFQAFNGNDFQKTLAFALDFKILNSRRNSRRFMVLFSNGCISSGNPKRIRGHSVKLSFQPSRRNFKVEFNTTDGSTNDIVKAEPTAEGWYRTRLYFEDATVNLEVNGNKLITISGMTGTIPGNQCPLYIGGQEIGDKNTEANFYGFMENFIIFKDCRYHDSNIKIL